MLKEIHINGPIVVTFIIYDDFLTYSSGVYQHTMGKSLGPHSVKVLGWGEDNGVKYWLVANSWNETWGEKGFFKFIRGGNNCGFEDDAVSASYKE